MTTHEQQEALEAEFKDVAVQLKALLPPGDKGEPKVQGEYRKRRLTRVLVTGYNPESPTDGRGTSQSPLDF